MKNLEKLTNIIESILFVSGTQVAISDIAEKLEVTDKEILKAVDVLKEKYSGGSGVQILLFNKKLQFCSNPEYAEQVSSVLNPIKEKELSIPPRNREYSRSRFSWQAEDPLPPPRGRQDRRQDRLQCGRSPHRQASPHSG